MPTKTRPVTRPDMRDYFRSRIDHHVNGMLATTPPRIPREVKRVRGDVTDKIIIVEMVTGERFGWGAGRYSSRKVRGCYAPLMPTPANFSGQGVLCSTRGCREDMTTAMCPNDRDSCTEHCGEEH